MKNRYRQEDCRGRFFTAALLPRQKMVLEKINKDMIVTEALAVDPEVAEILMNQGMHCIFCGAAAGETLEEAGMVHGISSEDMERLCDSINAYLEQKEQNAKADA